MALSIPCLRLLYSRCTLAVLYFFGLKVVLLVTWFPKINRSFLWDKQAIIRVLDCQIVYNFFFVGYPHESVPIEEHPGDLTILLS